MQLSHRIELIPTPEQADYFKRACGTARMVWNWALAEWNAQYRAGQRPNAMVLKKQFNAIKYQQYPWLQEIHRDAHAQPFKHLARAWARFFEELKSGAQIAPEDPQLRRSLRQRGVRLAYPPVFKKKSRCRDSFYLANDKFSLSDKTIRLPKVGTVAMTEALRFAGPIRGATISRTADRWFVAIQVEVADHQFYRARTGSGITGIDLGLQSTAVLSSGEVIKGPKPLKAALRRLRIRSRRLSRKQEAAKVPAGFAPGAPLPKGARLPASQNRKKAADQLARLHARTARLRAEFMHQLTTRLCRENQSVVIEDLQVKGMLANRRLARAISDAGFGLFRQQMEYKAQRYGVQLIVADTWYPSSRLCSVCACKNEALTLSERQWHCPQCGTEHDRDQNAALNLKRLATATALPVASPPSNGGAGSGMALGLVGKVTPVRYEYGRQAGSGQEEKDAHISVPS
jgi:putative transposase